METVVSSNAERRTVIRGLLAMVMWCIGSHTLFAQPETAVRVDDPGTTVELWRQQLTHGKLDDRRSAAKATLELPDSLQAQLLFEFIDLLRHERDGQIRLALMDTLAEMGPLAKDAVPALENAMRRKREGNRNEKLHQDYRAAIALSRVGSAAVESLRNLLTDEQENLRAEAAMALGRIGPAAEPAIPDLVLLLGDESPRIRGDVAAALGSIGQAAIGPLLPAVRDKDSRVRAAALEALGRAGPDNPRVAEFVQEMLNDDAAAVRATALGLLGHVSLPTAMLGKSLLARVQDEDEDVQVAATNALVSQPAILHELKPELAALLEDGNERITWQAAFLLQNLGAEAIPLLLDASTKPRSRPDQLARALALVDAPLEDALLDALSSSEPRRQQVAALTLGLIRPLKAESIVFLTTCLENKDRELQAACLKSLVSLGSRSIVALPSVRALISHEDPAIRSLVIDVLSQAASRDLQLVKDLTGLVVDTIPDVQCSAIDALRTLGPISGSSITVVSDTLNSPHLNVRTSALAFLGSHGPAAAGCVPRLREEMAKGGERPWRLAVLQTLGQIGEGAQDAYTDVIPQLKDESPEIRVACLRLLSSMRLKLEQLRPHLVEAMRDSDESVRSQASGGIRQLGARGVLLVPDLIPLLTSESTMEDAKRLLERLEKYQTDPGSISALIEFTHHKDWQVRVRAIKFLGLAGSAAADSVSSLQKLLNDEDERVRAAASDSIDKIQSANTSSCDNRRCADIEHGLIVSRIRFWVVLASCG